ncbi:paraquat-inducible protein A [Sneathiella marina]|uniref:Paraquat-inducible protein A n=1 Tax=Sneathiella marina TaxID=2950108 RepID=A0ABY4W4Z5_9PROT|nr:paraquat-inducible protein A [Sneathiella marina]USG60364.1 paraquat-inducible protein A [Sneathiella marina]
MHWSLKNLLVGRPDRQTISKFAKGRDRYIGVGLLVSAALLGIALSQSIVTVQNFHSLNGSYSLIDGMVALFKTGQAAIAMLILVTTIVVPIITLSSAFEIWYKHELQSERFPHKAQRLRRYGRLWYLVFGSVLIGIYLIQNSEIEATIHAPIYYLTVSLALQKLALVRMEPLINSIQFVEDDMT